MIRLILTATAGALFLGISPFVARGAGMDTGRFYKAYMETETLADRMDLCGQLDPATAAPYLLIFCQALDAIRTGSDSLGVRLMAEALRQQPDFALGCVGLGDAYLEQEKWHPAIRWFQEAHRIAPDRLDPNYGAGRAWLALGETEGSEAYEKALAAFQEMVRILNAEQPRETGHPYSFDPQTNELAEQGKPSEYLDYVLYSKAHLRPSQAFNEVRMLRSNEEWKEFVWEAALWDLSDHYAVFGRLEFPGAPHKVRAEAPPASASDSRSKRIEYCRQYAEGALRQISERIERTGPAPANDPVWKKDFNHHYNWCLQAPESASTQGSKLREDWLNQHRRK